MTSALVHEVVECELQISVERWGQGWTDGHLAKALKFSEIHEEFVQINQGV